MDLVLAFGELWEAAKVASPFASLFAIIMWYMERSERRSKGLQYDALFERTLTAMNTGTAAIEKFSELLLTNRRR